MREDERGMAEAHGQRVVYESSFHIHRFALIVDPFLTPLLKTTVEVWHFVVATQPLLRGSLRHSLELSKGLVEQ